MYSSCYFIKLGHSRNSHNFHHQYYSCPIRLILWCRDSSSCPIRLILWCRHSSSCPIRLILWCRDSSSCPIRLILWCRDSSSCPIRLILWCRDSTCSSCPVCLIPIGCTVNCIICSWVLHWITICLIPTGGNGCQLSLIFHINIPFYLHWMSPFLLHDVETHS